MQKWLELNFLIGWVVGFNEGVVYRERKVAYGGKMGAFLRESGFYFEQKKIWVWFWERVGLIMGKKNRVKARLSLGKKWKWCYTKVKTTLGAICNGKSDSVGSHSRSYMYTATIK